MAEPANATTSDDLSIISKDIDEFIQDTIDSKLFGVCPRQYQAAFRGETRKIINETVTKYKKVASESESGKETCKDLDKIQELFHNITADVMKEMETLMSEVFKHPEGILDENDESMEELERRVAEMEQEHLELLAFKKGLERSNDAHDEIIGMARVIKKHMAESTNDGVS